MSYSLTISVDIMGGDFGPATTVPAALKSLKKNPHLRLILVGDEAAIKTRLGNQSYPQDRLVIRHATQVVEMCDPVAVAMREKKDSSMRVAINLVKEGEADACISAGNTGALMALSRFVLKTHPKIDRPAIITAIPAINGHFHMLDLGANVDSSVEHLLQFAMMGSVVCQAIDGIKSPRVALLNIGSEDIKGNEQIKAASVLLAENKDLNYIGYIEGDGMFRGEADVVVCDGFVGNIALKTSEGVAKMFGEIIKREIKRNLLTKFLGALALPIWNALSKALSPGRYNGASLVGLKGIVIKSHGSADVESFSSALQRAITAVEKDVPSLINTHL